MHISFSIVFIFLIFVRTTLSQDAAQPSTRLATEGEFPFVGYMIEHYSGMCGLVIISKNVIATAAHCFVMWHWDGRQSFLDLSSTKVLFGSLTRGDGKPGRIKAYKTPANFKPTDSGIYLNDIGIADLDAPLEFTEKIKPATFVSSDPTAYHKAWDGIVESGKTCLSIGWEVIEAAKRGDMTYHKVFSDLLKVTTIKPWKDTDCANSMPDSNSNIVSVGGVCASAIPKNNYKSLAGDEGGALYCDGNLYGVLSTLRVDVESERPAQFYLFDAYLSENYSEDNDIPHSASLQLRPVDYSLLFVFFILCYITNNSFRIS